MPPLPRSLRGCSAVPVPPLLGGRLCPRRQHRQRWDRQAKGEVGPGAGSLVRRGPWGELSSWSPMIPRPGLLPGAPRALGKPSPSPQGSGSSSRHLVPRPAARSLAGPPSGSPSSREGKQKVLEVPSTTHSWGQSPWEPGRRKEPATLIALPLATARPRGRVDAAASLGRGALKCEGKSMSFSGAARPLPSAGSWRDTAQLEGGRARARSLAACTTAAGHPHASASRPQDCGPLHTEWRCSLQSRFLPGLPHGQPALSGPLPCQATGINTSHPHRPARRHRENAGLPGGFGWEQRRRGSGGQCGQRAAALRCAIQALSLCRRGRRTKQDGLDHPPPAGRREPETQLLGRRACRGQGSWPNGPPGGGRPRGGVSISAPLCGQIKPQRPRSWLQWRLGAHR